MSLPTVEAYEELALTVELTTQQLLQAHNYNTVGNFVRFYEEFRASRESSLIHFYRQYTPPITSEHHTCVGLGLELLTRLTALEERFPGLSSQLHLVSCEEAVDNIDLYTSCDPDPKTTEKEHVLVVLHLEVAGRNGVMLLDPGYHVARVVTVMQDELYPHTGWFRQSDENQCRKDYNYSYSTDGCYVIWRVKEKRGMSPEKITHSIIFVEKPFITPVDVTERRNLVYNFRSLLARNTKGYLTAGIYFSVEEKGPGSFTIFYQDEGVKKRAKMFFNDFKNLPLCLEPVQERAVSLCNEQLGYHVGKLTVILHRFANILTDDSFIKQLLKINQSINDMAEDN